MTPSGAETASSSRFDVAILGTGIAGTLLGAILARHGARVLMLDRGCHPRFAIGESTVPETTGLFAILGERYDVPEIRHLANFQGIRRHVAPTCGVKRNFAFVYHRDGEEQRPRESTQFLTWAPPLGPDAHLFRQDVDAYLLTVAVGYGATVHQNASLEGFDIGAGGVDLALDDGRRFHASMLVDASGYGSPVARQLGLRETPTRLRTRSRSIFTHMLGVTPYDECGPARREHKLPSPFHQGTLHHLFDGGWLWVIPFDNHAGSTNPLTSVGLCVDPERFPGEDDPEAEFRRIVARFPSIARQLAGARAVRPWVSTPRIQYSSHRVCGDRFFLLPHAAGFVDPLFSGGLALTVATLNVLGDRLLEAIRVDDFSEPRFADVGESFQTGLDYYDRLVAASYAAFRDFRLWNAWYRVWMVGSLYGISGQHEVFARFQRTGDRRELQGFERPPYRTTQALELPEYRRLFDAAASQVEAVEAGKTTAADAAAAIYRLLAESPLSPAPWKLTDPERHCPGTFTLLPLIRLLFWGRYRSPEVVRRHYFRAGSSGGLVGAFVGDSLAELRRSGKLGLGVVRDSLFSWNRDWKEV